MKKNHIKHVTSILGVTAMLFFAGAADAQKEVGSESHKLKKGTFCVEHHLSALFDCPPPVGGGIGEVEGMLVEDIYKRGWRVVSYAPEHYGADGYNGILIIEQQ
jgi:hypothetical protein|uniref:Uncharacterized protein n=1 Tax=mine drainage metagenome TaxID=410659 RepID=E6QXD2_9ZZZZ